MIILERWRNVLDLGLSPQFSPSGQALAVKPFGKTPTALPQTLAVYFADGRGPVIVENDSPIQPLAWASDTEFVYRVSGKPYGKLPHSTVQVLSLEDHVSSLVLVEEGKFIASADWAGRPGFLSVLAEPWNRLGVFTLNVRTGKLSRLTAFDAALETLLKSAYVYPSFHHAWHEARQEIALIGGQHEPALRSNDAKPLLPPRQLYLLGARGECIAVPQTHQAQNPFWSPDGTWLSFERSSASGDNGIYLVNRQDLQVRRLGKRSPIPSTIVHPSGVLLARFEAGLPQTPSAGPISTISGTPARWHEFPFGEGQVLRQ